MVWYDLSMDANQEIIDIVDEKDQVIGQADRERVHKEGLLHRHVHIWLFNDHGQVILQRRSKSAKSHPDVLDPTAGGHIPAGETYEQGALAELGEETGIKAKAQDLIFLGQAKTIMHELSRGIINNVFNTEFAYRYNGSIAAIVAAGEDDEEKDIAFELWNIDDILNIKDEGLKKEFVPAMLEEPFLNILKKIKSLAKK